MGEGVIHVTLLQEKIMKVHPIKIFWILRALFYRPLFNSIGRLTYIGRPCFIEGCKRISIGEKTRIFPGIRMEAIGTGSICIGNNCAIEENVHIISKGNILRIGDDTTISANVFISNVDHDYQDITKSVMNQPMIEKETRIGRGCFIGFGASVLPGTTIGDHCVIGSNAVVKGRFSDHCVIVGAPAKVVKIYQKDLGKWEKYQ